MNNLSRNRCVNSFSGFIPINYNPVPGPCKPTIHFLLLFEKFESHIIKLRVSWFSKIPTKSLVYITFNQNSHSRELFWKNCRQYIFKEASLEAENFKIT